MNIKDFYNLIETEQPPVAEMLPDLQVLIKKYPFFQAGIFTYIKCLYIHKQDVFSSELHRLVPFVQDRKALFYYVMREEYERFTRNTSRSLSEDRTNILINAFFETFDNKDIETTIEYSIMNTNPVSSDYFSYVDSNPVEQKITLAEEPLDDDWIKDAVVADVVSSLQEVEEDKNVKPMKHQDIIDNFISRAENMEDFRIKLDTVPEYELEEEEYKEEEIQDEVDTEMDDDFFFTQTLANIYIKQKKYQRAYEIIKRLSLNYPEKNIYFADQLSFLEKIIRNSNNK